MQNHKRFHALKKSIFIALFFKCTIAIAINPEYDASAPIQIQSDTASISQKNHNALYEGNVIMTQGSHELHANKLTINKDPKGGLNVIVATGKPATFSGKLTTDPHPIYATAKVIYYYPNKRLIVLEGAATLDHQQDKFTGPVLSYQIDNQVVSANSQNNERPTITIHPQVSQK